MKSHYYLFSGSSNTTFFISCLFVLFLLFCQGTISSQDIVTRPKVGLVLSGGGARGIAHIGVLKVMEEAGLRPDYITGVSMGSIIGGLYSLGYNADSLHKLLNKTTLELVLSNKIPENKVIYLEKNHFYNSIISLPLSYKKVKLPSGLISGQQIENALSLYLWPAADINDFSKLPIPFMCLGTDILTGKKVELKTGYLPDAIRASIAIPTILTPIKIDNALLIDGGAVRNFPVEEVREMGADFTIGSFVGFHVYTEDELQSMAGIVRQLISIRTYDDFEEQKKRVDIFIEPDISDFSASAFSDVDTIFERGYRAALPFKDKFKRLADSLNIIGKQNPLMNILDKQSYSFDKIEVTGNKIYSDYQILGVLDIKPDEKIDRYLLHDRIELLYGKVWFDKVKYRIVPRNDSLILIVDCLEKPQAMLYGSVHYDNSLLSGLILETSVKNLITQRSVINLNSYIGQYYRFDLDYLQFIDRNQKFGLSANFYADNSLFPMLEIRGHIGNLISRNFTPGLTINKRLGLNHMMSISANFENTNLLLRYVSESHLKSFTYNYFTTTYDYKVNTLDTKHFPDKGMILNLSVGSSILTSGVVRSDSSKTDFRGNNHNGVSYNRFFTFYGNFKRYFTSIDKLTFAIGADALIITESDSVSAQNNFYLMGGVESINKRSIPMVGYHSNEKKKKKMAGIRSELDTELFENIHVKIMANIFVAEEAKRDNGYSLLTGYGLEAGYMSIIGPLRIGIMYGNNNRESYFRNTKGYICIGYNF